jgi:hypothetical protein
MVQIKDNDISTGYNQYNEQPRKRGRPRKNQIVEKPQKKEIKQFGLQPEKEIILHLPFLMKELDFRSTRRNETGHDKSDGVENQFMEKDDDSDDETQTMLTLSDEEDDIDNKNYYDVVKELHEKDKIIRQLTDELLEYENALTEMHNTIGEKENCIVNMKIPLIDFRDGKQIIPAKTDVCCWWCTYTFDTIPVYIPELYNNNMYYVFGCFCSFNCANAYNLNLNDYKVKERHSLLINMAITIYKKNVENDIFIAPQREILEKFGGPLSIAEYRKNFKACTKEYRLILPPMASIIPVIEVLTRDKLIFKQDVNKFSQSYNEKSSIFDSMGLKLRNKTKN